MKKVLALVLALCMVIGLAACGGGGNTAPAPAANNTSNAANTTNDKPLAGDYNIRVWAAEKAVALTKTQIENFNASNDMGIKFNVTIDPKSEADAGTDMITDIEAGPDIYFFAQDQFARLVQAGALAKLGDAATATVKAANDSASLKAATSGDVLYAYPATSDNGYFMFYDKSVIPDADVDSLEKLIADCEAAKKYFAFEAQTSAWYIASWFFGTGCVSEWQTDNDGKFVGVNDTFNSPNGLIAAKGMYKLVTSPFHVSNSEASAFDNGAAVLVSGTWAAGDVKKILGDNYGVADLPSFNVDGKDYHLGSYNGCKLLGVKPQTDAKKAAALHQLAQYLTSKDAQLERFNDAELGWGPSNLEAQKDPAVLKNEALTALAEQNNYSQTQGQIHGSWWDIGKVIGDDVKNSDGSDAGLQAALDNYSAKINSLFQMSDAEKNAWTVIGSINGDGWSQDLEMKEDPAGTWKTTQKYDLKVGDEFKVRQGKSWDVNFGTTGLNGDNFKVTEAGTYTIVFTYDGTNGTISLEK